VNYLKRELRWERTTVSIDSEVPNAQGQDDGYAKPSFDISTADLNPEEALIVKESINIMMEALESLSPRQRAILTMVFHGFRNTEIAEELDITPNVVGVHLCNARARITEILGKRYDYSDIIRILARGIISYK
jgi:RNA polymerase sigma factor (sigma-70 family)